MVVMKEEHGSKDAALKAAKEKDDERPDRDDEAPAIANIEV